MNFKMLTMINKIFKIIRNKFISPNQLAHKLGVSYGKNCVFRTRSFGSEPYLIEVGDNFETSSNVHFVTHDGSLSVIRNLYDEYSDVDIFNKIVIGDNVFIGINTTILPGTRIGNNVIVGAGSVVKGELKSNGVYVGTPAKYIFSIEEYKKKNEKDFVHTYLMEPIQKEAFIKTNIK